MENQSYTTNYAVWSAQKAQYIGNCCDFDVDNLCVFVRILSTQPAVYQHKSVYNAIFVATKKKKSNIFFVALALRFRI